jgi:hypothetical protein
MRCAPRSTLSQRAQAVDKKDSPTRKDQAVEADLEGIFERIENLHRQIQRRLALSSDPDEQAYHLEVGAMLKTFMLHTRQMEMLTKVLGTLALFNNGRLEVRPASFVGQMITKIREDGVFEATVVLHPEGEA